MMENIISKKRNGIPPLIEGRNLLVHIFFRVRMNK